MFFSLTGFRILSTEASAAPWRSVRAVYTGKVWLAHTCPSPLHLSGVFSARLSVQWFLRIMDLTEKVHRRETWRLNKQTLFPSALSTHLGIPDISSSFYVPHHRRDLSGPKWAKVASTFLEKEEYTALEAPTHQPHRIMETSLQYLAKKKKYLLLLTLESYRVFTRHRRQVQREPKMTDSLGLALEGLWKDCCCWLSSFLRFSPARKSHLVCTTGMPACSSTLQLRAFLYSPRGFSLGPSFSDCRETAQAVSQSIPLLPAPDK